MKKDEKPAEKKPAEAAKPAEAKPAAKAAPAAAAQPKDAAKPALATGVPDVDISAEAEANAPLVVAKTETVKVQPAAGGKAPAGQAPAAATPAAKAPAAAQAPAGAKAPAQAAAQKVATTMAKAVVQEAATVVAAKGQAAKAPGAAAAAPAGKAAPAAQQAAPAAAKPQAAPAQAKPAAGTDKEVAAITEAKPAEVKGEKEVIMKKTFTESTKPGREFKPIPEEFYNTLFYFSGMGSVIASSLASGVYVPEHTAKKAPSADVMEECDRRRRRRSQSKGRDLVMSARVQCNDLSSELRRLQNLLATLPTFGDTVQPLPNKPTVKIAEKAILAHTQFPEDLHVPNSPDHPAAPWHQAPPPPVPAKEPEPEKKAEKPKEPEPPKEAPKEAAAKAEETKPEATKASELPGDRAADAKKPEVKEAEVKKPEVDVKETIDVEQIQIVKVVEAHSGPPLPVPPSLKTASAPTAAPPAPATGGGPPAPPPPPPAPLAGAVKIMPAPPSAAPILKPVSPSALIPKPTSPAAFKPKSPIIPPPPPIPNMTSPSVPQVPRPQAQVDGYIPKVGGLREIGVHTGMPLEQIHRPWQERYGTQAVEDYQAPQPFGEPVEVDASGARSWHLSKLRAMEAKGMVPVDRTPGGADDGLPSTHLAKLIRQGEGDSVGSASQYAPFLVSQKSQQLDFEKVLHEAKSGQSYVPSGFKPVAAPGQLQHRMPPAKSPIAHVKAPASPFKPQGSVSPVKAVAGTWEPNLPYSDL